jgi:hypothetical protein
MTDETEKSWRGHSDRGRRANFVEQRQRRLGIEPGVGQRLVELSDGCNRLG